MGVTILGTKVHSVLFEAKNEVDDSCLFLNWHGDPFVGDFEIYPRLDGIYACGCDGSPTLVDESPRNVKISTQAADCIKSSAACVSSALDKAKIIRETGRFLLCGVFLKF